MKTRSRLEAADVKKAALLIGGLPAAWLLPPRAWPLVSRPFSRLAWLFARPSAPLPPGLIDLLGGEQRPAMARLRQSYIEDCLLTLSMWAPWRPRIRTDINGSQRLEAALAGGKGAIVWVAQTSGASLVAKMALQRAGHSAVHLSRPSHRFSATEFGVRFLNPFQTAIEGRYLAERLVLQEGSQTAGLVRLRHRLAENRVVSITAGGPAAEKVRVPFLGGTLDLPAGALRISMMTGAPVLPMYVVRRDASGFEVDIEAPLALGASDDRAEAFRTAAAQWACGLEERLRRRPEVWQGWLAP